MSMSIYWGRGLNLGSVHLREKRRTNHNLTVSSWFACVRRVKDVRGKLLRTTEAQESRKLLESHTREGRAEQNT